MFCGLAHTKNCEHSLQLQTQDVKNEKTLHRSCRDQDSCVILVTGLFLFERCIHYLLTDQVDRGSVNDVVSQVYALVNKKATVVRSL